MRKVQSRSARARRTSLVVTLVMTGTMLASHAAFAQTPASQPAPTSPAQPAPSQPAQPAAPGQQPAPSQEPAKPAGITFDSDSGILLMYVKADKTADFESAMAKLRDAFAHSERPERRQQAAGWKLFKAAEPGPNGTATYVNVISPVLKGADYTITRILYETFPTESQQIFPLLRDSITNLGKLSLTTVQDYTAAAKPAGQ